MNPEIEARRKAVIKAVGATYRERREAKVDRLREWADKREVKSAAAFKKSRQISDMIPFGQPILVGHHSERHARRDQDLIHAAGFRGLENSRKAAEFQSRAANIEDALDRSIYSDDPDAAEALTARIADLEAERAVINARNAAFRKAVKAAGLPKVAKWKEADFQGYHQFADYQAANLSGKISANRKRLAGMSV